MGGVGDLRSGVKTVISAFENLPHGTVSHSLTCVGSGKKFYWFRWEQIE